MEKVQADTHPKSRVKATLYLGSESYSVVSDAGLISQQLASVKAESMSILTGFITKHNVPNDVPDEPLEGSDDEESEEPKNPSKKSKKQK
ncbi:Synuclein protein [Dioscorea alata]|uniref:Synuclein protein n=4 Tax=Dioscorea alata TaxID=55571 RepID=A0ACB7V6B3_DIOAL|nr:Synuclein protein [Dioscorea alata]KAH7668972.1 Synuclein protein [Dioscorea alata]KAH7668973.1 Synuclein protein [Dioscorea alata]KAH7668974.1 Synuclein protein [Dioscorea alata]